MANPIVLIHGYSDKGESFRRWREILGKDGSGVVSVHTCNYETLTNEVTLRDIAEAFDRALRLEVGLKDGEEFDAIVHSTGMLVIRAWLTTYAERRSRLKRLVALAPATFGSPLAHKGRSWLGALFKGRRQFGPDFLEAGDMVLDGLELGSRFTWDLAHRDLLGEEAFYGPSSSTPFVFTFCGTEGYGGIRKVVHEDGTDGTVRWAGCPLNTRKVVVDLTLRPGEEEGRKRFHLDSWTNVTIPLIPVSGMHHGAILREPREPLTGLVLEALKVTSTAEYEGWLERAREATAPARDALTRWQQFVVRAVDERGDPITDYNLQLFVRAEDDGGKEDLIEEFDMDVHAYGADPSLRCFHVNLDNLRPERLPNLWLRVIASSGSRLVGYHGYTDERVSAQRWASGEWDAAVDLSDLLSDDGFRFFYPFTTTLVELRLNREPLPLEGANYVAAFEVQDG